MAIKISELMSQSGVQFGTSGARGLVQAITDRVAYAYTLAFLQQMELRFGEAPARTVALAGDLRPSSPRIVAAVAAAVEDAGYRVCFGGEVPSPAIALYGIEHGMPAIMVTGSHIPDDRNGIKFNRADGEIDKQDELGIKAQLVEFDHGLFDAAGAFVRPRADLSINVEVEREYVARWVDFFGRGVLKGVRIGVYQHSTVGRDILVEILLALGATVIPLGRSDVFVPVDTEAVRPEDIALAKQWAQEQRFDAIVSADGDCDRPLISDESGIWLRGDVVGVITAQLLGARGIATPVSCNTVVEKCETFPVVARTRIGSPYVIEAMRQLSADGAGPVVGYEANGGFLQQDVLSFEGRPLSPLPTRDAVLPIVAVILASNAAGKRVSELVESLPPRFTASSRIKAFATERSQALLAKLRVKSADGYVALQAFLGDLVGAAVVSVDETDGLRVTFSNLEIVHLRPSGNAPELRAYAEADSSARAGALVDGALQQVQST